MSHFRLQPNPARQTILMCPPDFFAVDYEINAWMRDNCGKTDRALAIKQWTNLRANLERQASIVIMEPRQGLPDLVFTANAAMVLDDIAIISRFRSIERQGEEPFNTAWFEQAGFRLSEWPGHLPFEGAGDALLDRGEEVIWAGHGFRSDASAHPYLESIFKRKTISLRLVDPRFYHLDTCLCPLAGGYMLYYPAAFDDEGRAAIEYYVPREKRLAVDEADAKGFACNAVDLNGHVFMNHASEALQKRLSDAGFKAIVTPLTEFLKSGGAAKCLTLKLYEPSIFTASTLAA